MVVGAHRLCQSDAVWGHCIPRWPPTPPGAPDRCYPVLAAIARDKKAFGAARCAAYYTQNASHAIVIDASIPRCACMVSCEWTSCLRDYMAWRCSAQPRGHAVFRTRVCPHRTRVYMSAPFRQTAMCAILSYGNRYVNPHQRKERAQPNPRDQEDSASCEYDYAKDQQSTPTAPGGEGV